MPRITKSGKKERRFFIDEPTFEVLRKLAFIRRASMSTVLTQIINDWAKLPSHE